MRRMKAALALLLLLAAPAAASACDLTLYEHGNYRGESRHLTEDTPWVGDAWNDRVSSVVIRSGRWAFFQDPEYRGERLVLEPGRYSTMVDRWDDVVSSLRCLSR